MRHQQVKVLDGVVSQAGFASLGSSACSRTVAGLLYCWSPWDLGLCIALLAASSGTIAWKVWRQMLGLAFLHRSPYLFCLLLCSVTIIPGDMTKPRRPLASAKTAKARICPETDLFFEGLSTYSEGQRNKSGQCSHGKRQKRSRRGILEAKARARRISDLHRDGDVNFC